VTISSIYRRILSLISDLGHAQRGSHIFRVSWRSAAGAGLCTMIALSCSNLALAANPTISLVTFTGTNADLHVVVSGTGFGTFPPGVPCKECTTPYLEITDGRGYGCQLYNIRSWTDTEIVFNRFQGNPGDSVLVLVTNPQNHRVGISGRTSIPKTIALAPPIIKSVSFAGRIGPNLQMTIVGSGFGASPPGFPFIGDLPFFIFGDKPFSATEWFAGYESNSVTLKYAAWLDDRIVIVGFGGTYGVNTLRVSPNDPVEIAVANSGTCGLNINEVNSALGPTSIGAVWGGHLP
jgi:hypothetical protein